MTEAEARRVCRYIKLGYSAWRIAELLDVPLAEVARLKGRFEHAPMRLLRPVGYGDQSRIHKLRD